jgi:superfamily II DNA or RNA helicase
MGRKYPFKTRPRPHQVKALQLVVKNNKGALLQPMRSGKTKVAIDWAAAMAIKHGIRRVLVVTHTPTTFGVWKSEIRKHCPLNYRMYVRGDYVGGNSDNLVRVTRPIDFQIINIQQVYTRERRAGQSRGWDPVANQWLYDWEPEAIIVDESTCIGDPTSEQSLHLYKLQRDLHVRYKLILTGTILHRNLFMSFGQFKFLDDTLFGTSWSAFKETYGLWGGYNKTKMLKYRNVKRWRKKVKPLVFQMKHVPLMPPVHQVVPVEINAKAMGLYNQMALDRLVSLLDGEEVEAPMVMTQLMKLAQMASGFIKSDAGKWYRVHHDKRKAYEARLLDYREAGKDKIVVFTRFLPTIRDIALASRKCGYNYLLLHGGVKHEDRERRYVKFNEDPGRTVFVSQISTGSMGIDLSAADTTIYYSLTESLLHFDQSMARIRRYRDTRTLGYDYLLAQGTVDEVMYLALQGKVNLVKFVMDHPELIAHEEEG